MNRFIAKLRTWAARLAFWRKPAAPAEEVPAPDQTVLIKRPSREQLEAAEPAAEPAPKLSLLARIKQIFRRQPKLPALEESDEPSNARHSASRDEDATDAEVVPAPKLSILARLRQKLRRQPKLEALEDSEEPSSTKQGATRDLETAQESDADEAPKVGALKRLLALLSRKWVWIPSVSLVILTLIGGVAFMLVQASHEKAKLKAELQKAQKKIEQQAAVVKQATAAQQAAAVTTSPDLPSAPSIAPAPPMIGSANAETKPGVNAGDCLVTSKESVAANLKGCIESFNAKVGARPAGKKP